MKIFRFVILWAICAQLGAALRPQRRMDHLRPKLIDDSMEYTNIPTRHPIHAGLYCEQEQYLSTFISETNKSQELWITWNRTKAGENALLPHMCSALTGLPLRRRCLLMAFRPKAVWEAQEKNTTMIQCHLTMFCEEEKFEHHFIQGDQLQHHVNLWKRTKINDKSTLKDMCLKTNGLPLTRKCFYDRQTHRATWESVSHLKDIHCLHDTEQPIISNDLNRLLGNVSTKSRSNDYHARLEASTTLLQLLESPKQHRLPADVHLSNEILKGLVADTPDIELSSNVLQITHNLMGSDTSVLRMSAELNATNCLLETFENYMDAIGDKFVPRTGCSKAPTTLIPLSNSGDKNASNLSVGRLDYVHIGVYAHVSGNISVFFVNPSCANITGIAIYPSKLSSSHGKVIYYDSFNDFHYRFVFKNESVAELMNETDLELAAYVPQSMWLQLEEHFRILERNPVIVFKVYAHDGLFVEPHTLRTRKPFSKILSISIPGYEETLPGDLPFFLRQHSAGQAKSSPTPNSGCAYWNYSTWTSSGVQTSTGGHNTLMLCYTNHLTQFSYLIGGSFKQNDLTDEILITATHQEALDIISLVGCTLSLMGLIGIWITAILFKSWRAQASNKILLNMCVALTLQMVLFLFVNTDDISESLVEERDYTKCVLLGACLQYSILVLFTWMLLIALLQFQRYVTVIGIQRPKHYIAKSAILAWGLPLIPTLCVALIDPKSYIPTTYQLVTDTGICYPTGSGLHFGVILPVGLIVLANLTIFVYVFYSISRTLKMSISRTEKKLVIKQIRLSILLFFLLGLSWIFGLFAFMKLGVVFSYLFCLTATMQGFVLFVYFVILDEGAKRSWLHLLCPHTAKEAQKKARELQSMATASTSNGFELSSAGH